jgi:hypothetical protein
VSRRLTLYLDDRSIAVLGTSDDSLSGRVNRAIDRYGEIVRRHRPWEALSDAELLTIRRAAMGWIADPAAMIDGGLALEVADMDDDEIAEGVDRRALVKRLRALPYADHVAMVAWAERLAAGSE